MADRKTRESLRRSEERKKAEGLRRVFVWVPEKDVAHFLRIAKELRAAHKHKRDWMRF